MCLHDGDSDWYKFFTYLFTAWLIFFITALYITALIVLKNALHAVKLAAVTNYRKKIKFLLSVKRNERLTSIFYIIYEYMGYIR